MSIRHMSESKKTNPGKHGETPLATENAELKIIVAEQMLVIRQLKEKISRAERLADSIKTKRFIGDECKLANAMDNSIELRD